MKGWDATSITYVVYSPLIIYQNSIDSLHYLKNIQGLKGEGVPVWTNVFLWLNFDTNSSDYGGSLPSTLYLMSYKSVECKIKTWGIVWKLWWCLSKKLPVVHEKLHNFHLDINPDPRKFVRHPFF